jgi:Mg-chelatase subunit ChlD
MTDGSGFGVVTMARGVYSIGSKLAQRVRAVQIVDCAGNSTTLRLKDYISRKIQPEYEVLPWQEDVALASANEKLKSK